MYELGNKIRLVNVSEYPLYTADAFVGFILGMISQNRDLEFVFLDSFLKLANLEGHDITSTIDLLEKIGEEYKITFILSVSKDVSELPENAKKDVIVSL